MAGIAFYRLPLPPSLNNLYVNSKHGGRFKSEQGTLWYREAAQMVMIQRMGQDKIPGPYKITMTFERCRADLANLEKAPSDLLVDMGVVRDDSLCQEIILRWGDLSGVEVTIEAV